MICFIVALPAEAKPIINHYQLLPLDSSNEYKIFQNDFIALAISGAGKTAIVSCVNYLYSLLGQKYKTIAWINVGIAGHKTFKVGRGFLAHKITDRSTQQSWYPPCTIGGALFEPIETHSIMTTEAPELEYSTMDIFDMEASAYYQTASSFSTGEIIKCYKIISDNIDSPTSNINAKFVKQLMQSHLPIIDQIVESLKKTLDQVLSIYSIPQLYYDLLEEYHFTETQQHQLKQLLRSWFLLAPDPSILHHELDRSLNARKIISKLTQKLQEIPVATENRHAKV